MADILVYALHYEGAINKNSLGAVSEAASLASQIGGEAHAVVVGEGVSDDLAASLGNYGVTKVFRAEAPEGLAQPVIDVMAKIMSEQGHQYALFGGGLLGFEIGAGLAARLGAGVTMEVTHVNVADGRLTAERPILGDSSISTSSYKDKGIIIGRLNAFEANESGGGAATVEDVQVELSPWSTKAKMVQRGEQRGADVDIEGADILVAGGRGLGKPEGFELAEALAKAFGGNSAVAPSEFPPPVDSTREFIKRGLDSEEERIDVGVAIVGGGTAGLACANRLLQLLADDPDLMEKLGEVPVAVIEKAKTCGGHNLSGAVMRPGPLQELFPDMTREDWRKERFAYGEVEKEAVYMTPTSKI